jgi:acetyl esterase/lipase
LISKISGSGHCENAVNDLAYEGIDCLVSYFMQFFLATLSILLTLLSFGLSIWSVIPANNMTLLPLSVAAPELSIWLLALSSISLVSYAATHYYPWPEFLRWLGLGLATVSIILNLSPYLQLSGTIDRANTAMNRGLGDDYFAKIPSGIRANFRSAPFVIATALQGIPLQPIRIQKNLKFVGPDGAMRTLNLYQPLAVGKYPGVVQIYGGAWRSGNPNYNEQFSRYLAARGYVVVAIDYRHAPQYPFPAQLEDVRSALDYIRQQAARWEIDADRLALMGRSAGGHLATLAAYQPDAVGIRAVVSYYGPVNLLAGYDDPPQPDPIDSRQVLREFLGGTPTEFPDLYRQASPYLVVDAAQRQMPPTLLIYGGQDHLVEARYGRKLADKLQSVNTPTVYISIPWANHSFDEIFNGPSNQLALYYTERFLARLLF